MFAFNINRGTLPLAKELGDDDVIIDPDGIQILMFVMFDDGSFEVMNYGEYERRFYEQSQQKMFLHFVKERKSNG